MVAPSVPTAMWASTGVDDALGRTLEDLNRWLGRTYKVWENVLAYEALGDGSADDTTAIQNAIDNTPTNGTLVIPATENGYVISDSLTVDHAMTILSNGAKIAQTGTGKKGLYITASNVTVDGLYLYGRQKAAAVSNEFGIHADGTDINGYLTRVLVRNCRIENWGFYGVLMEFVKRFSVRDNEMRDLAYSAASFLSCHWGRIRDNDIDMNSPVGSSGDAYGISLSHNTPANQADITNNPVSSDISVIGNLVLNNTLWEGIDTHAGERIRIIGNEVYNCKVGISVVPSDDVGGTEYWAPHDVKVIGNTIDSTETDGSAGPGIQFVGALSGAGVYEDLARGVIEGNTVKGHGAESSGLSGGISIYGTEGLSVAGNEIHNCSPVGINLYHTNYGFTVADNTIVDPWSDTGSAAWAIRLSSSNQSGFLSGNAARNGDLAGKTHILDRGIDVVSGTNMDIRLGPNHMADATLPIVGAANVTSGLDEETDGTVRFFAGALIDGALELDGALNHDGTTVGFYGVAPTTRQVLATGGGATVDQVISALQTLGLLAQS